MAWSPDAVDLVLDMARDVVAIGPGLGQAAGDTSGSSPALVDRATMPLIVDADGLNAFSKQSWRALTGREGRDVIITPHPGEFARLSAVESRSAVQPPHVALDFADLPSCLRRAERTADVVATRKERLHQPDRQSRDGHRRHRRYPDWHHCRLARASSPSEAASSWPCTSTGSPATLRKPRKATSPVSVGRHRAVTRRSDARADGPAEDCREVCESCPSSPTQKPTLSKLGRAFACTILEDGFDCAAVWRSRSRKDGLHPRHGCRPRASDPLEVSSPYLHV